MNSVGECFEKVSVFSVSLLRTEDGMHDGSLEVKCVLRCQLMFFNFCIPAT
jgi:hypothetical protein